MFRMGFAYANESIIQYMNNVKAPYNVNRLTQEVAVRALSDRTLFDERVAAILEVGGAWEGQRILGVLGVGGGGYVKGGRRGGSGSGGVEGGRGGGNS